MPEQHPAAPHNLHWFITAPGQTDILYVLTLNIIKHLLSKVPYKDVPREKVKLPKRDVAKQSPSENFQFRFIPEVG